MTEDEQRLKNLILFKAYLTDDELTKATPVLGAVVILAIVFFIILKLIGVW